jgi:hypothetical protein
LQHQARPGTGDNQIAHRNSANSANNGNRDQSGGCNHCQKRQGPHYSFRCGSSVWHSSLACSSKKAGHKDAATKENKMGGSTKVFKQE